MIGCQDVTMKKMKNDSIIKFEGATIQHGHFNDRIYLIKPGDADVNKLINYLDDLAQEKSYTKIFAKVPAKHHNVFISNGYKQEAYIPKFYKFREDAGFMAKYYEPEREESPNMSKINNIIDTSLDKETEDSDIDIPSGLEFSECRPGQAEQMSDLYSKIFETYPFPIHKPDYILKTMREDVRYFGIFKNEKLIALSSAEIDPENLNAEMTDFATLPEYRGHGLALYLLQKMETEMRASGIKTLYTIARAVSYGMNITFSKAGYEFSGTLINNTNICGNFESMNVWYKHS